MKHLILTKKQTWFIICGAALVAALMLCVWLFGWGCGNINVIDFSANEVDYVWLGCDQLYSGDSAVVTDPEEIQALIDSVNAFQHTGSDIKNIFRYGLFAGGNMLYEHAFFLSNGDKYVVTFASSESGQPMSNMDLAYWVTLPDGERVTGHTCRGSLEVFFMLHKKYLSY